MVTPDHLAHEENGILSCGFLLQESPVSHSDSELLQQVHRSENGQIGCLGVERAMIGFNFVLIDAPHGFSSACPVKKPTVAAFALQPVGRFVFGHTVMLCSKDAADVFKLPAGFAEEMILKYPEVSSPCFSSSGRILSSQLPPLQFLQVGVFMSAVKATQGVSACTNVLPLIIQVKQWRVADLCSPDRRHRPASVSRVCSELIRAP